MQDNVTIMCHYIIFGMCMSFNSYFFLFFELEDGDSNCTPYRGIRVRCGVTARLYLQQHPATLLGMLYMCFCFFEQRRAKSSMKT